MEPGIAVIANGPASVPVKGSKFSKPVTTPKVIKSVNQV
jgi:hypothetical protein